VKLAQFEKDPQTKGVVLIGEVGGNLEEEEANSTDMPIVSYSAGISAPPDKRMDHAGAIVEGGDGDARSKKLDVPVAVRHSEIPGMVLGLF
jgi:succinyl-CoA synthetase alpha subunit